MKNLILMAPVIAALGTLTVNHADACATRFPTFELTGFPISRHQVAVLGSAHVQESTATPALTWNGMPASPHQVAVLTPRAKPMRIVQASPQFGLLTLGPTRPELERSTEQTSCGFE
jgi:hypothetical protein